MLLQTVKVSILGTMLLCLPMGMSAQGAAQQPEKPKLILQITVDQLQGDLPGRFKKNMGGGGFRYLMEKGIWYANANYTHSNTETVVGHTTLATGVTSAQETSQNHRLKTGHPVVLTELSVSEPWHDVAPPCFSGNV